MSPKTETENTHEFSQMLSQNEQLIKLATALAPHIVAAVRAELIAHPVARECNFSLAEVQAIKSMLRYARAVAIALLVPTAMLVADRIIQLAAERIGNGV